MSILPIFLYGSDCWAISKTDARRIDALNQWCLRMLLGIKWYQFVWNDDVRRLTKQPKLTAIIQSCQVTLFGHIMCMDDNADAKRILLSSAPTDWRRHPGHPRITRLSIANRIRNNNTLHSRSSRLGSDSPSVEDEVDVWCYAILELHARNDDDTIRQHQLWNDAFLRIAVVTASACTLLLKQLYSIIRFN